MADITLRVNGSEKKVTVPPETPLLWVLRDTLELTGTKFGCGAGLCGACTVHVEGAAQSGDRKSTRLNSSHTEIYTLSLHDALPISLGPSRHFGIDRHQVRLRRRIVRSLHCARGGRCTIRRSEEHTSELQSHRDLHSFPTRRSSDLSGSFATLWN